MSSKYRRGTVSLINSDGGINIAEKHKFFDQLHRRNLLMFVDADWVLVVVEGEVKLRTFQRQSSIFKALPAQLLRQLEQRLQTWF